jgi:hypothetical protein
MKLSFSPEEADALFEQLPVFATKRSQELSKTFYSHIVVTDKCARLVSRLLFLLGHIEPVNTQDKVIRDLMADVFDFLYESRDLTVSGKVIVAFPLARRAYESLTLLVACAIDEKWAIKWQRGTKSSKIENNEIRKFLSTHPMGESEESMKRLYNFFCDATHPNRNMIGERRLGEGNQYVLGMFVFPHLLAIADLCITHIELWHWLMQTTTYFYMDKLLTHDPTYLMPNGVFEQTVEESRLLKIWLIETVMPQIKKELAEIEERQECSK